MPHLSRLIGLGVVLVFPVLAPAQGAPAEGAASPPRVKPLAERLVAIAPWESNSASPYGSTRMGGNDERGFAFSPDGSLLAGASGGGWELELWDLSLGKSRGRFGRFENPPVVAFSPDGKALVAVEPYIVYCTVELWDVGRRQLIHQLDEDVNTVLFTAAAFSPDGKTLALGGGPGRRGVGGATIHLWDASTGDEVRWFAGPAVAANPCRFRQAPKPLDCLAYSPDGRSLALVADHQVLLWETATGKERCWLGALPPAVSPGDDADAASCLAFSPDGRTLAVGGADGAVRLWDLARACECPPLIGPRGGVRAVRFAPDSKTLWSLGQDDKVLTWPAAGSFRDWRPAADKPSAAALEAAWAGLASDDVLTRYAAAQALAAAPGQALPVLRGRLHPVAKIDAERAARLVAALGSEDFNERKKAVIELRALGEPALPVLRQAAAKGGYNELLERVQRKMEGQGPTPEQLQACRGVEVLGRMGGDGARRLLAELADGAPEVLLTRQAKAALGRLDETAAPAESGEPSALWDALAADDGRRAYQAVRALAARPEKAVPFLCERLRRAAAESADDPARVARLIADLGNDDFDTREKASRELAGLAKPVEPALRKALEAGPAPEPKRRLEELLKAIKPELSPRRLQAERALEALEQVGGPEVRRALEAVGKDARDPWLKGQIAETLSRLSR